jgi:hypothetical protein
MVPDTVQDVTLEDEDIGSFNHGYTQLRLGGLLDRNSRSILRLASNLAGWSLRPSILSPSILHLRNG